MGKYKLIQDDAKRCSFCMFTKLAARNYIYDIKYLVFQIVGCDEGEHRCSKYLILCKARIDLSTQQGSNQTHPETFKRSDTDTNGNRTGSTGSWNSKHRIVANHIHSSKSEYGINMYDLRESAVLEYIESRPYSKGACTRTAPRQAAFTVLGTCDVLVALGIALGRSAPLRIREGT
jgi:hypothetical protein